MAQAPPPDGGVSKGRVAGAPDHAKSREGRRYDPAAPRLLCRGLRSAGRGRLLRDFPARVEAVSKDLADHGRAWTAAPRFRVAGALGHRGFRPELAGLHPLRILAAGAYYPGQYGRA